MLHLDAQAAEHGVRLPAAKQHDSFGSDVGTEQGGGAARTQGTGGDFLGEDAKASVYDLYVFAIRFKVSPESNTGTTCENN